VVASVARAFLVAVRESAHAVPVDLVPHDVGFTLCGKEVVVPRERASKTAWCWPTCVECDASWREREA
jgi:zinc finger protein